MPRCRLASTARVSLSGHPRQPNHEEHGQHEPGSGHGRSLRRKGNKGAGVGETAVFACKLCAPPRFAGPAGRGPNCQTSTCPGTRPAACPRAARTRPLRSAAVAASPAASPSRPRSTGPAPRRCAAAALQAMVHRPAGAASPSGAAVSWATRAADCWSAWFVPFPTASPRRPAVPRFRVLFGRCAVGVPNERVRLATGA